MQSAVGCAEQECLAPVPGGMIADCKPKITRAPESEAHVHAVDENHDDAKFVFAGIRKMHATKDD